MLEGKRVYLRLVERADLPKRVEWINDPEVQRMLNFDFPTSVARTEQWFEKVLLDPTRRDFSIFLKEDDKRIGFCGLMHIDIPVMKAEWYLTIGDADNWGSGYGTEATALLVEYGFRELGLAKIYGYQLVSNTGCQRITEKLGWKKEGLLRNDVFSHGVIMDRYVVSILRKEWLKDNG